MCIYSRKPTVFAAALAIAAFGLISPAGANAADLAYWNFNDNDLVVDGGLNAGTATLITTVPATDIKYIAGTTLNAVPGDDAGDALALTSSVNNGGSLTFGVSTAGFDVVNDGLVVSFAIQRTGTGFNNDMFAYSTDGVNFTDLPPGFDPGTSGFAVRTYNLSGLVGLNAFATFRLTIDGATNPSNTANNRIDNLRVSTASGSNILVTVVPEANTFALALPALGMIGAAVLVKRRKSA